MPFIVVSVFSLIVVLNEKHQFSNIRLSFMMVGYFKYILMISVAPLV